MTAQKPFHHVARRAGGFALLPMHPVALVHHGDFLTKIVGLIGVGTRRDRLGLAWHDDQVTTSAAVAQLASSINVEPKSG